MLEKIKRFLTGILGNTEETVIDDPLLALVVRLKGADFDAIDIDVRLNASMEVYSKSLVELSKWIEAANHAQRQRRHMPHAWMTGSKQISEVSLDDYLLNEGRSYDLNAFMEDFIREVEEFIELSETGGADDQLGVYYQRIFQVIVEDLSTVLTTISHLIN